MSTMSTYLVTGMTCGHCVTSVKEEIGLIAGVDDVTVHLVTGGESEVTVTSAHDLEAASVTAAVEEAGYQLAPHNS